MQKSFTQYAQFIKSFGRYTWLKSPVMNKISHIFDYAHPIIIKVSFSFPKFVSECKKSALFMNSFLRYKIHRTQRTMIIFDLYYRKIIKVTFVFPKFFSTHQKFIPLIPPWDAANFSVLRPDYTQPLLNMSTPTFFKPAFNSHESVSICKKSGFFITLIWRYSQSKNPTIWLTDSILMHFSGNFSKPDFSKSWG